MNRIISNKRPKSTYKPLHIDIFLLIFSSKNLHKYVKQHNFATQIENKHSVLDKEIE